MHVMQSLKWFSQSVKSKDFSFFNFSDHFTCTIDNKTNKKIIFAAILLIILFITIKPITVIELPPNS